MEGAQWGPATAADAARSPKLDHKGIVGKRDFKLSRIWGFLMELRIQNHKTPPLRSWGYVIIFYYLSDVPRYAMNVRDVDFYDKLVKNKS
jgi:hypothetical protein